MAYSKKTWKDRITEYPNRRELTHSDSSTELVTVARSEGTISQEGDAFSAQNMNDLEGRIDSEFSAVDQNLQDINDNLSDLTSLVESNVIYSSSEEKVGKVGNDDLYKKSYSYNGTDLTSDYTIDSTINKNTLTIVKYEGVCKDGSGFRPFLDASSKCAPRLDSTLYMRIESFSMSQFYLTIYYTKNS